MATEITSKIEKFELKDGNEIELTLNFAKLLWLRAHGYGKEVEIAMQAINKQNLDFIDMPYLFYGAYLCALPTTEKPKYTQNEFIELMPFNLEQVSEIFGNLIEEKKTEVSKIRSSAVHKKAK